MRRRLIVAALAVAALVVAAIAYHLATSKSTDTQQRSATRPTSVIGSGKDAVGVSAEGVILVRQAAPADGTLPQLPLSEPPKGRRLAGPMLEQARVLGAAPAVLRSCIEGSYYGESGVDVNLDGGIELLFGSASRAAKKWRSAVAILADPSTTDIGYVDLHSPTRVSTGGSGSTLPPAEPGSGTTCGE